MKRLLALLSLLTALTLLLGTLGASAASLTEPVQHRHKWGAWKEVSGDYRSCTDHKILVRTCSLCGLTEDKDGGEVGHDVGSWKTVKKPTCTEPGRRTGVCSRCGKTVSVTLKAAGHKFGPWSPVRQPSRTEPGLRERACTVCGFTESEEFNYPTLSRGGRNNRAGDVKELQSMLNKAGYPCGKADGKFGKKTEDAVKDVEKDHGLEVDGVADPLVWITLDDIINGKGGGDEDEESGLRLVASLKDPQDSYGEGDTAYVSWTVYNDSKDDMSWPEVFVMQNGDGPGIANSDDDLEASFPAGASCSGTYHWLFEKNDMAGDDFTFEFIAAATPQGKAEVYSNDVSITVALGSSFSDWKPPELIEPVALPSITVEKTSDTQPANGSFFTEGETVAYTVTVTNVGPDLTGGMLHDELMMPPVMPLPALEAGKSVNVTYTYTVTEDDADAGTIENTAVVFMTDGEHDVQATAALILPAGADEAVTVTKAVTSVPLYDPSFYVEGETIFYEVTVTNDSDTEMHEIEVYDPLCGSNEDAMLGMILTLAPHESYTFTYSHKVDADDVSAGTVENTAFARYWDEDGEEHSVDSNTVTVDVGEIFDITDSEGVSVVKKVTNHPKHGDKYTEGENVEYLITVTNNLPHTLYNTEMYDVLIPSPSYLANLGDIPPGGSASATYTYKITKSDVETGDGTVVNYAWIVCIAGRERELYSSNRVIVQTGKTTAARADVCVRTLRDGGSGLGAYELDFCREHEKTAQAAYGLLAASRADEAYAAWKGDIEELYAQWKKKDPANAAVIEADRKAFFEDFDALRALLASVSPDKGESALYDVLSNKCADLCYALGRAPEARRDAYRATGYAPGASACSAQYFPSDGGPDMACAETACPAHAAVAAGADELLGAAAAPSERDLAFRRVQRLWLNAVNSLYDDLFRAGYDVTRERMLFGDLLDAREAALTLLYPASPETVSELIATSLKLRALTLCAAQKGEKPGASDGDAKTAAAGGPAQFAGTWRLERVAAYGLTFDAADAAKKLGAFIDLSNGTVVIDGSSVDAFGRGAREFAFTDGQLLLKGPAADGALDETVRLTDTGIVYTQYGIEYYFTR